MESSLRRSFLRRTYQILGLAIEYLNDMESPYVDGHDLTYLMISLLSLDASSDGLIDFEPRFFAPLPAALFNSAFEDVSERPKWRVGSEWGGGYIRDRYTNGHHTICYLGNYKMVVEDNDAIRSAKGFRDWCFGGAYSHLRQERDFSPRNAGKHPVEYENHDLLLATTLEEDAHAEEHHQKATQACCTVNDDNSNEEGRLLRSEVIAIALLMRDQIRQSKYWDHYLFPVLIYSFSGYSVRILQAHYDPIRDGLTIRMTPYLPISADETNTKLLLRWMLGTPIGETKFESLKKQEEEAEEIKGEGPRTPSKKGIKV